MNDLDYADHKAAMEILGAAKYHALDAMHQYLRDVRNATRAGEFYGDGSRLFFIMDAYSAADGAWNRIFGLMHRGRQ